MLRKIIKRLYCLICMFTPHKKTIIFESGDNVYDNGFVFAQFIANRPDYKKYRLICIGKRKPRNRKQLKNELEYFCVDSSFKNQLKLLKISLRAKYIFYSYDNYWKYIRLNNTTKIFFIRHGAFPLKNVKDYYDSMFDNFNHYFVLCNTPFVMEQLDKKYHKPNITYFLSGMPRCDLVNINKYEQVLDLLNIDRESKIVIVACTFRNFDKPNSSFFEDEFPISFSKEDILSLNEIIAKENIVLVFKLHHAQFCNISDFHYSNIVFVDNDILEKHNLNNFDLFVASHALVTDYSGIFMDYLLVDKPIGFILADKDNYCFKRGFTIPNFEDYLPGEIINNKSEFIRFLTKDFFNTKKFKEKRLEAKNHFIGDYSNCCESLLKEVEKL